MPSVWHEALVLLFRNRPELTEIAPTEYRADLVVLLVDGIPVFGIVLEVQLERDARKRYTWPVYATALRARLSCPTCVLVVTPSETVATSSRAPIALGAGNTFVPLVIGPSAVPRVTEFEVAEQDPELAILSVIAHGLEDDGEAIALQALRVVQALEDERAVLYSDLVLNAVSAATRAALEELMASGNYVFQSDFAKKHQAKGREEGRIEGRVEGRVEARAEDVLAVLDERGLTPSDEERAAIEACTDGDLLAKWIRKAVTAPTVAALLNRAPPDLASR